VSTRGQAGEPRKQNHAQRKRAARLKKFIEAKGARSGKAEESPAEPTAAVATTAPIELDERMTDAAHAHDADARRGQKRAAGVAPAPTQSQNSTPMAQQPNGSEGPRAESPVEPAGKRSPGLRPAGQAACRKAYAEAALEASRESRTSEG